MHKRPRSCWGKCVLAEFFFSEQRCFCRSAVLPETDLIHDCPNMASTDLRCNPFNFSASLTTSIVLPSRLPFKFASKLRKILCLHLQLCQPEYLRDIVYSSCLGLALSFSVARRIYLHRKCGTGWARQACMQTLTLQTEHVAFLCIFEAQAASRCMRAWLLPFTLWGSSGKNCPLTTPSSDFLMGPLANGWGTRLAKLYHHN